MDISPDHTPHASCKAPCPAALTRAVAYVSYKFDSSANTIKHRLLVFPSNLERSTANCKAKPCREAASAGVKAASVGLLRVSDHEMTAGTSLEGDNGKLLLVVLMSDEERYKDGEEVTFVTGGVEGVMDVVDDMKKLNKSSFLSSGGGSTAFSEVDSSVLILERGMKRISVLETKRSKRTNAASQWD